MESTETVIQRALGQCEEEYRRYTTGYVSELLDDVSALKAQVEKLTEVVELTQGAELDEILFNQ